MSTWIHMDIFLSIWLCEQDTDHWNTWGQEHKRINILKMCTHCVHLMPTRNFFMLQNLKCASYQGVPNVTSSCFDVITMSRWICGHRSFFYWWIFAKFYLKSMILTYSKDFSWKKLLKFARFWRFWW